MNPAVPSAPFQLSCIQTCVFHSLEDGGGGSGSRERRCFRVIAANDTAGCRSNDRLPLKLFKGRSRLLRQYLLLVSPRRDVSCNPTHLTTPPNPRPSLTHINYPTPPGGGGGCLETEARPPAPHKASNLNFVT